MRTSSGSGATGGLDPEPTALRVLVVCGCFPPAWSWGGQVRSLWNMCRGLARAGASVRVLTTDADLHGRVRVPRRRREEGLEVRVSRVPWGMARLLGRYAFAPALPVETWRWAPQADLCVLQGIYTFPLLFGGRVSRARGVPYVVCPRGTLEEISRSEKRNKKAIYLRLVERANLARAAAIQFASEEERRNSVDVTGSAPAFVCENAVDFAEAAAPDPAGLKSRLGLEAGALLVGISGRLHARKGFEVIVPALARCDPGIHLVAFGADEAGYADRVRAMAAGVGVGDRFHYLGQLMGKALQEAYASVDLLAVPSFGESFGNVVVEALAQGTEVLVSERVPLGRYVEQHRLGGVVSRLDPDAWAGALDAWARRRGGFDRAAAALCVRRDFSIETKGRQLLAEYRRLVDGRRATS